MLRCDFKSCLEWFAREFGVDVVRRRGGGRLVFRAKRAGRPPRARVEAQPAHKSACCADPEVYGWLVGRCGAVADKRGIEYLGEHGIPLEVAGRFGLRELRDPVVALRGLNKAFGADRVYRCGLAWGDGGQAERLLWSSYTVLFPFHQKGAVVYLQGRGFAGDARYLSLRGMALPLFNRERLEELAPGAVVHICEGVADAIAMEGGGLTAVGVLGANGFRAEWVDLFTRLEVVVAPDGDSGGETFFRKVSKCFAERGRAVRRVRLPEGEDVSDVMARIRRGS
jgi:hypothetical protein